MNVLFRSLMLIGFCRTSFLHFFLAFCCLYSSAMFMLIAVSTGFFIILNVFLRSAFSVSMIVFWFVSIFMYST